MIRLVVLLNIILFFSCKSTQILDSFSGNGRHLLLLSNGNYVLYTDLSNNWGCGNSFGTYDQINDTIYLNGIYSKSLDLNVIENEGCDKCSVNLTLVDKSSNLVIFSNLTALINDSIKIPLRKDGSVEISNELSLNVIKFYDEKLRITTNEYLFDTPQQSRTIKMRINIDYYTLRQTSCYINFHNQKFTTLIDKIIYQDLPPPPAFSRDIIKLDTLKRENSKSTRELKNYVKCEFGEYYLNYLGW